MSPSKITSRTAPDASPSATSNRLVSASDSLVRAWETTSGQSDVDDRGEVFEPSEFRDNSSDLPQAIEGLSITVEHPATRKDVRVQESSTAADDLTTEEYLTAEEDLIHEEDSIVEEIQRGEETLRGEEAEKAEKRPVVEIYSVIEDGLVAGGAPTAEETPRVEVDPQAEDGPLEQETKETPLTMIDSTRSDEVLDEGESADDEGSEFEDSSDTEEYSEDDRSMTEEELLREREELAEELRELAREDEEFVGYGGDILATMEAIPFDYSGLRMDGEHLAEEAEEEGEREEEEDEEEPPCSSPINDSRARILRHEPEAKQEANLTAGTEADKEHNFKLETELEQDSTADTFNGDESSKPLSILEPSADESDLEERDKSEEDKRGTSHPPMSRVKRARCGECDGNQKASHSSCLEHMSAGQDVLNDGQPVTSSAFGAPPLATEAEKQFSFGKGQLSNFDFKLDHSLLDPAKLHDIERSIAAASSGIGFGDSSSRAPFQGEFHQGE
jgi:hypothetical protein